MNEYLWQYVLQVDPFAKEEDVVSIEEVDEWDLLIEFKNGKKILYDRFNGYYMRIFYDDKNNVSEEYERTEFAYRLRSLMKRNWITQEQLAEKTNTSQVMISRYVRGETIPSMIMGNKLAKALGCSMDDFFHKNY